jgi:hypothetical protein
VAVAQAIDALGMQHCSYKRADGDDMCGDEFDYREISGKPELAPARRGADLSFCYKRVSVG